MVGTSALALTSSDIAVDNRCSLTTHDPPVNQFTPISFSSATRWKVPCKQAPSLFSYTPHSPEHTAGLINPHCIEVLARLEKGRRWGVLGAGLCCLPLSSKGFKISSRYMLWGTQPQCRLPGKNQSDALASGGRGREGERELSKPASLGVEVGSPEQSPVLSCSGD